MKRDKGKPAVRQGHKATDADSKRFFLKFGQERGAEPGCRKSHLALKFSAIPKGGSALLLSSREKDQAVMMPIKKLIIAGVFLVSPYVISNYLVFAFLLPVLCLSFAEYRVKRAHLIFFILITSLIALAPISTYDAGVYLFGVLIVSAFIIVFLIASDYLIRRFKGSVLSAFIPPVIWILLLYSTSFKSLGTSAFDVGVLFPASAPLIWYVGSIGLTLLIILFNSALARYLVKKDKASLVLAASLALLFIFSHLFSITREADYLIVPEESKKIALIQGDIPERTIFGYTDRLSQRITRYIDLTEKARKASPSLAVWPEYTLPVDLMSRFPEKMTPITGEIKKAGIEFVIGSMLQDKTNKDYSYNGALIFNKEGKLEDTYYSQDPALFNRSIRPKDNGGKLYLDGAGITLCWEEVNSNLFRDYALRGAKYFISLASNTDLDYSWFKRYASFSSRARAAENMRYLARSTQSGITQIIDPAGRVTGKLPSGRPDFLVGRAGHVSEKTFYTQQGDILTKIFILAVILASLAKEVRRFRGGVS